MLRQEAPVEIARESTHPARSWVIGLTSLLFVLLQSACSAFMAISGLRLLIGIGSLAAAGSVNGALDAIHGNSLRLPMMFLALAGTLVNLYAIWRVRSLRARPSSQWRMSPVDPKKRRSETIQLWVCFITLILLATEWIAHVHTFGSFGRGAS